MQQPQTGFWMGWEQSLTVLRRHRVISRRQARKVRLALESATLPEGDQELTNLIGMVWLMQLRPASRRVH